MNCFLPESRAKSAVCQSIPPDEISSKERESLKQGFAEFGPHGILFFDELLRTRRQQRRGVPCAATAYGLRREDLARALERAMRYRAFSWSAVERIVAAQSRPRSGMESLAIEAQGHLDEILRQTPLAPRSNAEYQPLIEETAGPDEDEKDDDPHGPVA